MSYNKSGSNHHQWRGIHKEYGRMWISVPNKVNGKYKNVVQGIIQCDNCKNYYLIRKSDYKNHKGRRLCKECVTVTQIKKIQGTKKCIKCNVIKSMSEFYGNLHESKFGNRFHYSSYCISCYNTIMKNLRDKNYEINRIKYGPIHKEWCRNNVIQIGDKQYYKNQFPEEMQKILEPYFILRNKKYLYKEIENGRDQERPAVS